MTKGFNVTIRSLKENNGEVNLLKDSKGNPLVYRTTKEALCVADFAEDLASNQARGRYFDVRPVGFKQVST